MSGDWPTVTIANIAEVARGGSPRPIKKFVTTDSDGVNWIKIGDTEKGGRYITKTAQKIIRDGIKRSRWVDKGDFLLSNSMSFGRPYILKTSGCIHDGWLVLRPDYARIDQDFLYYALSSPTTFAQFDAAAAGSTVRNLNIGLVEKVSIPLPSLEEQKRIVAVLDKAFAALDRARALAEANLADAEELFETALDALIEKHGTKGQATSLGAICKFENGDRGKNYPGRKAFVPAGVPFINAGHIDSGVIHWESMNYIPEEHFHRLGKGKVAENDFLFCLRGSLGKFGKVNRQGFGAIASSLVIVRAGKEVLTDFLGVYFKSKTCATMIAKYAGGAAQPNLSAGDLKKFEITLPDKNAQERAIAEHDKLGLANAELAGSYRQQAQSIDALRQSILQKAFAGELT